MKISNSALVSAVIGELCTAGAAQDDEHGVTRADLDRLSMSSNPFLEKSLEFLGECMDDLAAEQQKVAFYQRNLSRQQLQQAQWLQKRKQENAARRAAGQEPLPEEEENPAQKQVAEPSRLEGFPHRQPGKPVRGSGPGVRARVAPEAVPRVRRAGRGHRRAGHSRGRGVRRARDVYRGARP